MNEPAAPIESAVAEPVVPIRASRRDPVATRQKWVDRVQRYRDSNLSVAPFCRAEGVSVPAFYFWRRTLAADSVAEPTSRPTVVPVRIARPVPAVEVVLPSGAVLSFSADCDPQHVAAVLRAVGAISC
jgi:transposase